MLIDIDRVDGCRHSWPVESVGRQTDDNAGLVAENCPAKMDEFIEHEEAADADADENQSDGHCWPHPGPNGAQVRVLLGIEMPQALDCLTDLDVTHACVQHLDEDD